MTGFACHDASNIPYRGTLSPSAFKDIYPRGNVSFIWDIWALCAAAWLTVAEAYPCMDILALAQKPSVRQPLQKHKHQITVNYSINFIARVLTNNCL